MNLLDLLPARVTPGTAFKLWLADNRPVYELFKRFASEVRAAGHARYSARAIVERIRWHYAVETRPLETDPFKLNDHLAPYLARKLIEDDPTFAGFFELRRILE